MIPDTAIIMNPSAHDWEAKNKWPEMAKLLKKHDIAYKLFKTKKRMKTVDVAKKITESGFQTIVMVGGDGTINEVINGIMQANVQERPKIGFIPFGTANDNAKSFNIWGNNLEEHIRTLVDGLDYPLDLGIVDGERYFADAFTIGYDASVLKHRNLTRSERMFLSKGFESYVPSMIKEFLVFRKNSARLKIDGNFMNKKIYSLIVKNTRMYAGMFVLNEQIRGNDGKLDLFLFQQGFRFWTELGKQITANVSEMADPTGLSTNIVRFVIKNYEDYQAESLEIELPGKVDSQLDGEYYKTSDKYSIQCVKHALTLRVPYPY
ncbi:MAG: YegS/Rv2252/BmrU family lipid kinase [SAR324 cluster bacterium]|nr:YegS/Rv2252/BmrU family lipid kinase [SAR324 cluster bacterium]MBF0351136.1 YegS/Rv2252/BmrU family lipid kinase [SAR324 cluster bacterium]